MANRVIFTAVHEEAEKLIRRHEKYLSDLAANIRRKARRSGLAIPKTMHRPGYWSVNRGFDPYYVKSHSAGIAYAIDKALASGVYKPRPAVKYSVPKADGTDLEVLRTAPLDTPPPHQRNVDQAMVCYLTRR